MTINTIHISLLFSPLTSKDIKSTHYTIFYAVIPNKLDFDYSYRVYHDSYCRERISSVVQKYYFFKQYIDYFFPNQRIEFSLYNMSSITNKKIEFIKKIIPTKNVSSLTLTENKSLVGDNILSVVELSTILLLLRDYDDLLYDEHTIINKLYCSGWIRTAFYLYLQNYSAFSLQNPNIHLVSYGNGTENIMKYRMPHIHPKWVKEFCSYLKLDLNESFYVRLSGLNEKYRNLRNLI